MLVLELRRILIGQFLCALPWSLWAQRCDVNAELYLALASSESKIFEATHLGLHLKSCGLATGMLRLSCNALR